MAPAAQQQQKMTSEAATQMRMATTMTAHQRHFSPMQVQPQQTQMISGRQQTSKVSSAISSQNHQYSHTSPFWFVSPKTTPPK
ncbi:hypothetical protein TYRP_003234 [Tyrophagus putrescentiae]|nr:hypothetical protein TYRP_003234 [Tyrophagus putrescentiae]